MHLVSDFSTETEPTTEEESGSTEFYSTTSTEVPPVEEKTTWLLPTLISVGAFLLALILLVILYKKWRCFGLFRKKLELAIPIKKLSVRTSTCSSISSCGSLKVALKRGKKYGIRLSQAEAHIEELEEDKENGFSMEFQALKQLVIYMEPLSTGAALQGQNLGKNRFSNILPYDKTRVVLQRKGESDYINANYVSGFQFEREFIATQGPLKNTVADFWNMCWETNCSCIVMLTRCYEKKVEKCYPYWPTEIGARNCGGIRISLEKQEAFRAEGHLWLVSHLVLEKDEEETEPRPVIHIAFLSWPDFGVVEPPKILMTFVNEFRKLVPYPEKAPPRPVLIHCSAGVGRSGVFIALDYLIQQLQGERVPNCVNIFQIVARMRRERMAMVQTLAQYTLIYKCLLVLVTKKELPIPLPVSPDEIQVGDWGLVENSSNLTKDNHVDGKLSKL
ncbi:Tyrosine-protein phosphatase 10D [Orchesella cincta]|uniref:protein-tyrosine-phosphatase n=1 Tax=Orchesella cincta TaxID=48709 RepID=A0A1D2MSY9_ORCCI|nr:Tyrosine-protein phosphatase 10D [Orchesella cincta]